MGAEFGWSRTSISIGVTIVTISIGLSALTAGALINRTGERLLIVFSMFAVAAGYVALSMMGPSTVEYWTILVLMAVLGIGCTPVTLSRILVAVFDKRRGTALGISLIGVGLAGTLPPLILAPVMEAHGWRAGYLVLAIIVAVAWPIVLGLFIFNGVGKPSPTLPQRAEAHADVGFGEALRHPMMVRLFAAFFCVSIATGGVVVHFTPMLVDTGYSLTRAGQMASLIGLSIIAGRLLTGIAIDRFFAPRVATILMAASAIGFLVLAGGGPELVPIAALLLGMSLGAEFDLVIFLTSRYFPPRIYGRAFGVLYAAFLVGVAVSPVIYAQLHDLIGSYSLAFLWTAVLLAISTVLFATLPHFPDREQSPA